MSTKAKSILELVRRKGFIRARDLIQHAIPTVYLGRLTRLGLLERVNRGLYRLPDSEVTEHYSLAEVAAKVPGGVVCLLSALNFHVIGTQQPHEVWLAIPEKARRPRLKSPRLRLFHFSKSAFTEGVETHVIQGVPVRVYSPAKTVADCFKYRNKIGLDVAMEALRESLRSRKCTRENIHRYARICRVWNVMRPYLEMEASS